MADRLSLRLRHPGTRRRVPVEPGKMPMWQSDPPVMRLLEGPAGKGVRADAHAFAGRFDGLFVQAFQPGDGKEILPGLALPVHPFEPFEQHREPVHQVHGGQALGAVEIQGMGQHGGDVLGGREFQELVEVLAQPVELGLLLRGESEGKHVHAHVQIGQGCS